MKPLDSPPGALARASRQGLQLPSALRWLRFAVLNTLRNRRRSTVTVSIAALGTAAILLAGGFALFTYQGLAQISARTTGHLIVGKPEQFQRDEDTPLQHGLDDVAAIKARLLADRAGAARAAAGGVLGPHQQRRQIHRDAGRRHRP